jgi:CheY-like chemotaxis protein
MSHPYYRNRETRVPRRLIVLVEDDPKELAALWDALRELEIQVLTSATGGEAWKLIAVEHPAVVVLDLALPDMDGFELLRQIREDPKTRRTCVIVRHPDPHPPEKDIFRAHQHGCDCFLKAGDEKNLPEFLRRIRGLPGPPGEREVIG